MPEDLNILHTYGCSPEPLKVKLTKGQKDSYGWEISASGKDISEILSLIRSADQALKAEYGGN